MAKKPRYTVLTEMTVRNLRDEITLQKFIHYFTSDSFSMAQSIAAGLRHINHSYRIVDGTTVKEEWLREGFNACN